MKVVQPYSTLVAGIYSTKPGMVGRRQTTDPKISNTEVPMAMVGVVPAWPLALVIGLGVAAVFAVLYRFLFLFWMGGTPGDWLAGLTGDAFDGNEIPAEERPRFR